MVNCVRNAVLAAMVGILALPAAMAETVKMVLTFDDLPYAADNHEWQLPEAQRVTAAILGTLEKHDAPAAGFVNEAQLHVTGEVDARTALLQQWIDTGAIVGNHTFSHVDFNQLSIENFKEEIIKGDIVTRRLMENHAPYQRYFRHPYTHTGNTESKKLEIERFLTERGYKVTPHTIDSHDYLFNRVYRESLESGDQDLAGRVCDAYAQFVGQATAFSEDISREIFDRPIPHTLLLHANDINADCLDKLLEQLVRRDYEFISLDTAMADPAYKTPDTLVTEYGPTWLWRWMRSKDMNISFRDEPEPPGWITDLYQEASR